MQLGNLSAIDFLISTEKIVNLAIEACDGRVISVLEGGYHTFDPQNNQEDKEKEAKRKINHSNLKANNTFLIRDRESIAECIQCHLKGLLPSGGCICKECQLLQKQDLNRDKIVRQKVEESYSTVPKYKKRKSDPTRCTREESGCGFLRLKDCTIHEKDN